jgi:hypothetical protein
MGSLNIRFIVCLIFMTAILVLLSHGDALSQETGQIEYSFATGSITGQVVSLTINGELDGQIFIDDGIHSIDPVQIDTEGGFSFARLLPGTYILQFKDFGEIPLGYPVTVHVAQQQTTNVILNIPMSLSGMSCDSKLAMGFDGYASLVDWAFAEFGKGEDAFLSEIGQDSVAEGYGECKLAENDLRLGSLSPEIAKRIKSIRTAIEAVEDDYFSLSFYGGTAAGHSARRAIASREDLINTLINFYVDEYPVTPALANVKAAHDIIDSLTGLPDFFRANDPSLTDPSMKDYYAGYSDTVLSFEKGLSDLQAECDNIPASNVVDIAYYLKFMLDQE